MPDERSSIGWDILAALLLTISITMLADFTRRLLSADPDGLGIAAISVQAALALIASSTFTDSGWAALKELLGRFARDVDNKARSRSVVAAIVFVLVALIWSLLPPWLADYYTQSGFTLEHHGDPSAAKRDFLRAIALDPTQRKGYVDLGAIYEGFYRFDEAEEQYRKALAADHLDPTPYNNLSRLLLLDGKALTALRITDDALLLDPSDPAVKQVAPAMLKNRAWAEYQLGFYRQAIADATESNTVAGDCILGKAYAKLGQAANARAAWVKYSEQIKTATSTQPMSEPDCSLLAEDSNETK